jgi:hypothetical protein
MHPFAAKAPFTRYGGGIRSIKMEVMSLLPTDMPMPVREISLFHIKIHGLLTAVGQLTVVAPPVAGKMLFPPIQHLLMMVFIDGEIILGISNIPANNLIQFKGGR